MDVVHDAQDAILEQIKEKGWASVSVLADDDSGEPPFTYSVAFEGAFQSPEIVMVGLEPELAQKLVDVIAGHLEHQTIEITGAKQRIPNVIQGYDILVRPVSPEAARRLATAAFLCDDEARLVQICIPDRDGRLPDDPDCDPVFVSLQELSVFCPERVLN